MFPHIVVNVYNILNFSKCGWERAIILNTINTDRHADLKEIVHKINTDVK